MNFTLFNILVPKVEVLVQCEHGGRAGVMLNWGKSGRVMGRCIVNCPTNLVGGRWSRYWPEPGGTAPPPTNV